MSWVRCQVNYSATEAGGAWVVPFERHCALSTRLPLYQQALAECTFEVASRRRNFGADIGAPIVLSVFVCDRGGWWHAVTARDGEGTGIQWPDNLA